MKQIADDPIIAGIERTGYPPFLRQIQGKFVINGENDEDESGDDDDG